MINLESTVLDSLQQLGEVSMLRLVTHIQAIAPIRQNDIKGAVYPLIISGQVELTAKRKLKLTNKNASVV